MTELLVDLRATDGYEFYSDNVEEVGYDRETQTLYVEFQSSPAIYSYVGVLESTYNLLVDADSVGGFINRHIKGRGFGGEKYDDGCMIKREPEVEDVSPQGDKHWLSTDGDQSPFDVNEDNGFLDTLVVGPSKYGVTWTNGTLTMEPVFEAMSEADALAQFQAALTATGIAHAEVRKVTHYFD